MDYLITLDLGTTSVKTSLFDRDLCCVASYTEEYQLLTPGPTLVELTPSTYWDACVNGIQKVVQKAAVQAVDVTGVSISTQGETIIPVDSDGKALCNAIVWIDARAKEQAEYLSEKIGNKAYFKVTGLPECGSANPICKLMWIRENMPDVYEKTYKFLLLEDYIIFRLTGQFVMENTNASSSGYFDTRNNRIWLDGLEVAGIDADKIPPVAFSGAAIGKLTAQAAAQTGLGAAIVYAGANDQICGAVGSGNISPGVISETTGTSLAIVSTARDMPDTDPYNVTFSRHVDGNFIMLSYSATSGIIYKWFKDVFCADEVRISRQEGMDVYNYLNGYAEKVARGADGLLLLPTFAGKLSPDYNEDARGVFFGVDLGHTKAHFVRAILEGIGYMLRENLEVAYKLCGETSHVISLGGGAKSPLWCQIKADITAKEIRVAKGEGASLGAAVIGAVGAGWFQNTAQACETGVKISDTYFPDSEGIKVYDKLYERSLCVYRSLLPAFQYN